MKKFLSFFATLALALGFTACEDVPAPFAINDEGGTFGKQLRVGFGKK